ncbi:MAG: type II toxin-antitoxin system VapC family toxin [Gordonia sp. (in: high G+C Gram-positive bacteria)]|uniref:type II toxin-antitoxin system VapC family toxin n=1 Tax=Gordonia sp. (in: high G+C Gram-positive bacteria) TaxID=84139 RepID=UPI0039E2F508
MTVIDTSVLIDVLRGDPAAQRTLGDARSTGRLHASEITRLEVLGGMRSGEEKSTRDLLDRLVWHPLDAQIAEVGAALGRRWRRSHPGLGAADLTIAAIAYVLDAPLLTRNVKHFPMFDGLTKPY